MSLSAELLQSFQSAATNDTSLQEKLVFKVSEEVFRQILEPIEIILSKDAVYSQFEAATHIKLSELRQMCLEAHASHTTDDISVQQMRSQLSNTLQSIMEKSQNIINNNIDIDHNELYLLPKLTGAIEDSAKIHKEYMHNSHVADALEQVADNIMAAQDRKWMPEITNQPSNMAVIDFNDGAAVNDAVS